MQDIVVYLYNFLKNNNFNYFDVCLILFFKI